MHMRISCTRGLRKQRMRFWTALYFAVTSISTAGLEGLKPLQFEADEDGNIEMNAYEFYTSLDYQHQFGYRVCVYECAYVCVCVCVCVDPTVSAFIYLLSCMHTYMRTCAHAYIGSWRCIRSWVCPCSVGQYQR
jgi:hypothetical protein